MIERQAVDQPHIRLHSHNLVLKDCSKSMVGKRLDDLRRRAEIALQAGKGYFAQILEHEHLDLSTLLEELRIYQAELELQNEDLITTRAAADQAYRYYAALFNRLPLPALVVDSKGVIHEANEAAYQQLDLVPSARRGPYSLFRLLADYRDQTLVQLLGTLNTQHVEPQRGATVTLRSHSGVGVPFGVHCYRMDRDLSAEDHAVVLLINLSAEVRLTEREQYLQTVLWGTHTGTWQWNARSGELKLDATCLAILGYAAGEAEFRTLDTWLQKVHPEDRDAVGLALKEHLCGQQEYYEAELRMQHRQGHWIWVRERGKVISHNAAGEAEWLIGTQIDISQYKQTEQRLYEEQAVQQHLRYLAYHDMLTGLPNRRQLLERLREQMQELQDHLLAVVYVDVDGFKRLNDHYGVELGDALLRILAQRLSQTLAEQLKDVVVARTEGDEFVAVLPGLPDQAAGVAWIEQLSAVSAEPIRINGYELRLSISLGVTFYPQPEPIDAEQLLRQAMQSLCEAKQAGKNRYHLFDADLDRRLRARHDHLEHIRHALNERQFLLYYQPKVHLRTGDIIGVEALIRWQHPEQGVLPPSAFLPQLNNHPLSVDLGNWVLETALRQANAWRQAGRAVNISINIDGLHLQQADFVSRLQQQLAAWPEVCPAALELEILETTALEDSAHITKVIQQCRALGVKFALDDFGSGYSSLVYLQRLPVNILKIDQGFIRGRLDDDHDLAIVDAILGLATAFGRDVIAEGVETLAHGRLLIQLGCTLGQGYAIAKPMPAEQILSWCEQWQPSADWMQCRPLAGESRALLFAIAELRSWFTALLQPADTTSRLIPALDYTHSLLGQWFAQQTTDRADWESSRQLAQALFTEVQQVQARHQNTLPVGDAVTLAQLQQRYQALLQALRRCCADRLANLESS